MASTATQRRFTTHPAFRAFIVLWFAALIGLGLWVMPTPLHEAAIARSGLSLPPQIAPRLAISGAGAVLGLLLGLLIAARAVPAAAEPETWDDWDGGAADLPQDAHAGDESPAGVAVMETPQDGEPRRRRLLNPREDFAEDGIAASHAGFVAAADFDADDDADGLALPGDEFADYDRSPQPAAAPAITLDALADLTLTELTARLARALDRRPPPAPETAGLAPPPGPTKTHEDALRNALEKLSRVNAGR